MDPYEIIFHPYVTEKTMNMMEKNNALEFVVKRKANKLQIKKAVEKMCDHLYDVTKRIERNMEVDLNTKSLFLDK